MGWSGDCDISWSYSLAFFSLNIISFNTCAWADPDGGTGGQTPHLKNHKAIELIINTGPNPLEVELDLHL